MRYALFALIAATAALALATPAAAAQAPQPRTQVVFDENDLIVGDHEDPNVDVFYGLPPPKFENLIRLRTSFERELLDSVNEL